MRFEVRQSNDKWIFNCQFGKESHAGELPVNMKNYAMLSDVMKVFSHYRDLRIEEFKDRCIEDALNKKMQNDQPNQPNKE